MNDTAAAPAYEVGQFVPSPDESNYYEHPDGDVNLQLLFGNRCQVWGTRKNGAPYVMETVKGGLAEGVAWLNNQPAPERRNFILKNHSQGYDDIVAGTSKADALAAYRKERPHLAKDNIKVYVCR